MVSITIVHGAYKQTYNWGGPHCGTGWKLEGKYQDLI